MKLPEKIATKSLIEAVQQVHEATKKKMDPVGKEDSDINNDEEIDSTDKYLKTRRAAIAASMKEEDSQTADKKALEEITYSAKEARAGKDIGQKGKKFKEIATKAAQKYGSAEAGKKVAGAVLAKLRSMHKG